MTSHNRGHAGMLDEMKGWSHADMAEAVEGEAKAGGRAAAGLRPQLPELGLRQPTLVRSLSHGSTCVGRDGVRQAARAGQPSSGHGCLSLSCSSWYWSTEAWDTGLRPEENPGAVLAPQLMRRS